MDIGTLTGQIVIEDRASSAMTLIGRRAENLAKQMGGSFGAIAGTAAAVGAAVSAVSGTIIALGNRGSDVNDVATTFEHFSGSAMAAAASMEALRKGTLGTVGDFDLMKSASKLLAADVKLTSTQFGTLSSAAFVLQNQGLGPTKQMLDMISQAMLTGRTRSLAMKIGVIDTTSAMKAYAESHNVAIDKMTQAQKLEATRTAILDALARKVKEAGTLQRDFGESMEAAIVSIKNWGDQLARSVAASPAVMRAVTTIGDSISKAFGHTGAFAITAIVEWIEKFANIVTSVAPTIISGAARIKNAIVDAFDTIQKKVIEIWDWLVDFNDRWQITTNLIAGAKTAWGLLQKAFDMVRGAVLAVVDAWATMPEWLQRLTRTALEGAAVMAIYAGAIKLTMMPIAAIGTLLNRTIDILYELSSTVYYSAQIWKPLTGYISNIGVTLSNFKAAVLAATAAMGINAFVTRAMGEGYAFLVGSFLHGVNAIGAFNRAIGVTMLVEKADVVITGVLTAAKLWLARVILSLTINYNVLTARIGLATTAMSLSAIAARASAIAMTGLGLALIALKWIIAPLVVLYYSFKWALAALDWSGAADQIEYYSLKLQRLIGLVDRNTTNQDLWNSVQAGAKRRAEGASDAIEQEAQAFQRLQDQVSGKTLVQDVTRLAQVLESLGKNPTRGQLRRVADEAQALSQRGAELTPKLEGIRSFFHDLEGDRPAFEIDKVSEALKRMHTISAVPMKDPFTPLLTGIPSMLPKFGPQKPLEPKETGGEDLSQKISALMRNLTEESEDVKIFGLAFKGLSAAQKENYDIQQRLIPQIEAYAAAHQGKLLPAMLNVYNVAQTARAALVAQQGALLAGKNITLDYVTNQKEMGVSEVTIAASYGVTVEALQRYLQGLQKVAAYEASQAGLKNKELEAYAAAQNAGYKALTDARKQYDDMVQQSTMTSTEYQIAQIDKEVEAQKLAYEGLPETYDEYVAKILQIATKRKSALLVDEDALKSVSLKTLKEVRDKSLATWKAMEKDPASYSFTTRKQFKQMAEDAEHAFSGINVDYSALRDNSTTTLQDMADRAYNTWIEMEKAPKEYSEKTRAHFRKIYEEAQRTADGVESTFSRVYNALGAVSTILDNIPGLFGEIGSMAARAGQQMMQAASAGDWLTFATAGATAAIGIWGKLKTALNDGRIAIKNFAASFDTIKPGTGFDELHSQMLRLGQSGEAMWISLTQGTPKGNKTLAEQKIKEIQAALAALDEDVQKYSLSWLDLADAQGAASDVADTLVASYKRLTGAGYTVDAVLKGMSKDLNQFIIDSVKAGVKIPAAMQPIIEQLIRSKKLSEEAAKALLGIADDGVPSLEDVKAAADRYGLSLDALGPKVQQLRITEAANQIVADFKTLTAAGADFATIMGFPSVSGDLMKLQKQLMDWDVELLDPKTGQARVDEIMKVYGGVYDQMKGLQGKLSDVDLLGSLQLQLMSWDKILLDPTTTQTQIDAIMNSYGSVYDQVIDLEKKVGDEGKDAAKRMQIQIQELVSKALEMGLTLPAAMEPIIKQMIDAGMLTDQFGEALTDTTKLTFAKDLTTMFEELIAKLDEFIDHISGVGTALDGVGGTKIPPIKIPYYYEPQNEPTTFPAPTPPPMAGGGIVRPVYAAGGTVIPFPGNPSGSDTVPAWLTPGETVIPRGQDVSERPIVVQVMLDGRVAAEAIVPHVPAIVKRRVG